ncbi:ATP-binding protein [Pedobacter sp.]|uniref:ATP-binding protein n=1 Tax=Pedobacter sp. TaxID=1411316 RepID=UPI003BAA48D8
MIEFNKYTFQAKMENRLRSLAAQQEPPLLSAIESGGSSEYSGEDISNELELLRRFAATTGRFLPVELLTHAGLDDRIRLLNHFSQECNVLPGEQIEWILKSEVRSGVIAAMTELEILNHFLSKRLPPRDEFGRLLFEVLFNKTEFDLKNMPQKSLLELSNVLCSVGNINNSWIERVRIVLQTSSFLDGHYHIPENFMGRDNELSVLDRFVKSKPNSSSWSGYLLHGQGGSGKSTLLAKFCKDMLAAQNAFLCILDFDRPSINAEDELWLNEELATQLAAQSIAMAEKINGFRNVTSGGLPGATTEILQSDPRSESILGYLRVLLLEQPSLPLIFILDTMEQVVLHQSWGILSKWLDRLCDIFNPIPIKVILSGRIYEQINSSNIETTINLADFNRKTAIEFLVREGISRVDILRLFKFDLIPFRPLELRLISRILKQGQVDMDELVRDISSGKDDGIAGEYFMGSIYRRILGRIDDPMVRRVAYPGLILRYVNPQIILEILQPVLELENMDDEKAAEIVEQLEKYAWLAHRDNAGNVWHRRDLRQVMLKQMMTSEKKLVLAIQQRAIAYFENSSSAELSAEAMYHRMMMDKGKLLFVPEPANLEDAVEYLRRDISDLPAEYNSMIRYAETGEIDTTKIDTLPLKYFNAAYHRTGKALIAKGLVQEALELYQAGIFKKVESPMLSKTDPAHWETEVLFQTGNFDMLSQRSPVRMSSGLPEEDLGKYLISTFPYLILPEPNYTRYDLARWLERPNLNYTDWLQLFSGENSVQNINRLSFVLTLMNHEQPFDSAQRSTVAFLRKMASENLLSAHVQESLMLLDLISGKGLPNTYLFGTNYICLDLEWLQGILSKGSPDSFAVELIIKTVLEASAQKIPARQLLSNIDIIENVRNKGTLYGLDTTNLSVDERTQYLSAPQSVLRTTCKWVLYKAMEEGLAASLIRHAVGEFNGALVADLDKIVFKKRRRESYDWLDALIELIDRQWKLPDFIHRLATEWRHTEQLNETNQLLTKWIEAKEVLLRNAAPARLHNKK